MKTLQYRTDIDALRGVSVLLVVLFHAFPFMIPGGFIGVDVFFVISGYLITSILMRSLVDDRFSMVRFYDRRIRRLFPALVTVLLVSLVVGWLILFPDELKILGKHIVYSAFYIQNFGLINEAGYFDVDSIYKPLLHLWSLSIEEQYYVFWPLLLMFVFRMKTISPLWLLAVIVVLSFAANIYFITNYPDTVYYHTLTRIWQLGCGSLLAMAILNKTLPERKWLAFAGLFIIVVTAFAINKNIGYPGWFAVLPTLGTVFFILGQAQIQNWMGLISLGLISYPLYLWHWVVLSYVHIYFGHLPNASVIILAVLFSILLAFLTYRYVERMRHAKNNYTAVYLLLVLGLIGGIGFWVFERDGFPDRSHLAYLNKHKVEFTRTPIQDKSCQAYAHQILKEDIKFNYCRGTNLMAKKLFAIIGDSHAHVMYPGLASEAVKHGYGIIMLANSSCPAFIGFEWGRTQLETENCKRRIAQIYQIIAADQRIEKVFISTRGPVYIHGEVKGALSKETVTQSLQTRTNNRQTYAQLRTSFGLTIQRLDRLEHIKASYYFLENPELDFHPKEVLARPFDMWGISNRSSTVSKALYLLRMKQYRAVINETASNTDMKVIDPLLYLCKDNICSTFKDGKPIYADNDHFSVFGSGYVAKKISPMIFDSK